MTGEAEILWAILARLEALLLACDEDQEALGSMPSDVSTFLAMPPSRRVASRALLKTVEQLQDQLARLFRLLPKLRAVDTVGWYAQDYANFAEKQGVLQDGLGWSEIVKLRNRLVHDYPLTTEARFEALAQAWAVVPTLTAAARAARNFANTEGPFHD